MTLGAGANGVQADGIECVAVAFDSTLSAEKTLVIDGNRCRRCARLFL